jgi:hypothetical protein
MREQPLFRRVDPRSALSRGRSGRGRRDAPRRGLVGRDDNAACQSWRGRGGRAVLAGLAQGVKLGTDVNHLVEQFNAGESTQATSNQIVTDIGKLGDTFLAALGVPPGAGVPIAQAVAGAGLLTAAVVGGVANNVVGAIGSYDAFIKAGDSPSQALSDTLHSSF